VDVRIADESGAMNILSGSLERDDVERLYATDPFLVHGIFVLERVAPWLVFVDRWCASARKSLGQCWRRWSSSFSARSNWTSSPNLAAFSGAWAVQPMARRSAV
jgi:hypothetical protein